MKENKMNNSTTKSILIATLSVLMIIALVGGGTYAYWSWASNTTNANERTNVSFEIKTPTFTITGTNAGGKKLAPITTCYDSNYALAGKATAVAVNNTTTAMKATMVLKATLTPVSGRTLTNTQKSHLHWAIKQLDSDSAFSASNCAGTASATFATGTFADYTNGSDITTGVNFTVNPNSSLNATATKYYQLYVWIDSTYNYQNVGSGSITDPMQDMDVTLTFSENSIFTQDIS